MIESIGLWILAVFFVEAVTEIIVNSEIFVDVRNYFHEFGGYISKLISCGYCVSVWVALPVSLALPTGIDNIVFSSVIATFALHRMSNVLHEFVVRWLNRIPWTIQLNQIQHVIVPEMDHNNE